MNHTIKTIILACLVSAGSFVGVHEFRNSKRSNQAAIPAVRSSRGVQPVNAAKKRAGLKPEEVNALIAAASRKHGVPIALVESIVATESNFRCNAVSSRGAIGLMQLLPPTARQYRADASVPEQNVDAGTRYLRFLIDRYRHTRSP